MAVLKPLRHPKSWSMLWWLAVLIVLAVCLMPSPDLPELPHNGDKLEHALAFFLLAASAVQLYVRPRLRAVAIGLLLFGAAIEVAQGLLTVDRSADPFDLLADAVGIALGMATAFLPWRDLLLKLDGGKP